MLIGQRKEGNWKIYIHTTKILNFKIFMLLKTSGGHQIGMKNYFSLIEQEIANKMNFKAFCWNIKFSIYFQSIQIENLLSQICQIIGTNLVDYHNVKNNMCKLNLK